MIGVKSVAGAVFICLLPWLHYMIVCLVLPW